VKPRVCGLSIPDVVDRGDREAPLIASLVDDERIAVHEE